MPKISEYEIIDKKIHIIAHSMGGLDSRYMISKLGMADRVLSLTTISTPHHGSPIADITVARASPALNVFMDHLGINIVERYRTLATHVKELVGSRTE